MSTSHVDSPEPGADWQQTGTIGGKLVRLSDPYDAPVKPLVGRETELQLITAAWMCGTDSMPLSPLLLGEPGVGKNRQVYEIARRTRKDLYIFQGHEDVTAEDLACTVRFKDSGEGMDYVASPLVTAMVRGKICFIDEIAKIRPRALALLVSVLDERRYIDSTLLGERVMAHPGFRFIAATNTADLDGNAMPEFLRSRLRPVIKIGPPGQEEMDDIVRTRFPRLQSQQSTPLLDCFWSLWSDRQRAQGKTTSPTPRDLIYVFDLAISLADYRALNGQGGGFSKGQHIPLEADETAVVSEQDLRDSFKELFHQD